jgi:hypothetical protein
LWEYKNNSRGDANRHPQRVIGRKFYSGNREQIVFNG